METELMECEPGTHRAEQRDELVQALRDHLEMLPDLERQLVALYYGGGLSQGEIAAEMSLPRRTVASRMEGALQRLQRRLTQTGIAAPAAPVSAGALEEAICSGYEIPATLHQKVLDRIAQAGIPAVNSHAPRKATPPYDGEWGWVGSAAVACLSGLALWWLWRQTL